MGDVQRIRMQVFGNVQGVGYRALVKQLARSVGVKGYVKNLEDGSVEIYAEAPGQKLIEFQGLVGIKGEKGNVFSPNIDNIELMKESDPGFNPVMNAFRLFWVNYEGKISVAESEMIEKTEIAALMLTGFRSETRGKFDVLDVKYGSIPTYLDKINLNLEEMNRTLRSAFEKFP